jgi:hypothetical protein
MAIEEEMARLKLEFAISTMATTISNERFQVPTWEGVGGCSFDVEGLGITNGTGYVSELGIWGDYLMTGPGA